MSTNIDSIVAQLKYILANPTELRRKVPNIQKMIWESTEVAGEEAKWEILRDLAYDLEYYQPDPKIRSEETGLFGEERALFLVTEALDRLKSLPSNT